MEDSGGGHCAAVDMMMNDNDLGCFSRGCVWKSLGCNDAAWPGVMVITLCVWPGENDISAFISAACYFSLLAPVCLKDLDVRVSDKQGRDPS